MDINTTIKQNLENARQNIENTRQEIRSAEKCDNIDDPWDTHVTEYVSMGLSKLFIKLHIIPNVVTLLSMLTGVAGGVLLMFRALPLDIIGVFLLLFSYILDCCDGQVARLTKHFSKIGRLLDGLSDATVYFFLYLACMVRMLSWNPISNSVLWTILLAVFTLVIYLMYVRQCQLPDYFKNLHMYLIDNTHRSELARSRHIKAERDKAPKGSFDRFSLGCYHFYTRTQERRAPRTQELLDAVERSGKSDALCRAFYDGSRRLVKLTNLLTFNLRTLVLVICIFLHLELIGMLFVVVVLEPIRVILLRKYEQLSRKLLPLVQ